MVRPAYIKERNCFSKRNFFCFLLLVFCCMFSRAVELTGSVTCNGKGVADVVVTDGLVCAQTNAAGRYHLISTNSKIVYISTPSGYLCERNNSIPVFYKKIDAKFNEYNFRLEKNPIDDNKQLFLAQADVQLVDAECLRQYQKILPDCLDVIKSNPDRDAFSVDCGDIVGDAQSLYPSYIAVANQLNIPIYRAIGNHDMDYNGRSHETSTKTFESYFGPTRYSFNKGKVHYIVINNNFFVGRDCYYVGYIDENTFHWLEQDLSYVTKGSLVFVVMHIPTRLTEKKLPFEYTYSNVADQTINYPALYNMLQPFRTHIITGHMHYNLNLVHSSTLMEHITGAVCATWWKSDICLDGTPRGYGVYTVDGDSVSWYYKSAGSSRDHQMRVYPRGAIAAYPNDFIVNVWNWDLAWKVEWFENEINRGEMTRFTGCDPEAAAICSDKKKVVYDWISVFTTEHLFRATPREKNSTITVKVTDRFGTVYRQQLKAGS
jgi:hypothetical protein